MNRKRLTRALVIGGASALLAVPAEAQWSSDLPGIPRAGIATMGPSQGRFELDASWFGLEGDTTIVRVRAGVGKSWRIHSSFEFGFDFSIAQARWMSLPDSIGPGGGSTPLDNRTVATAGYGMRLGLKFRPIAYIDPHGNGIQAAVGVGYQPEIQPVITYSSVDSTTTGGLLGSSEEEEQIEVHSSLLLMASVSYRTPRLMADAALVVENAEEDRPSPSALTVYSGISPRLGVRYRLTQGFGVGASFWGSGAPPWRDRRVMSEALDSSEKVGFFLSFGSAPEKSFDMMISSPTSSFGESVSVYFISR